MDKKYESQLFEMLAAQPKFKEWLQDELDKKITVLIQMGDAEQLRRTQGYAQCLQNIITKLDETMVRKR